MTTTAMTVNTQVDSIKNTLPKTEDGIEVLKTVTCASLSGKTQLTYQVGRAGKDVRFRIVANDHAGCFSPEWTALKDVLGVLDAIPKGQSVTADALMPLFRGISANTPFFIFAALKHEGLVQGSALSKRRYDRVDPKPYLAALQTPVAPEEEMRRVRSALHSSWPAPVVTLLMLQMHQQSVAG